MYQHFTASLIRKTLFFLVATLLAGIALSALPFLMARADVIEVGCNVADLIQAITDANDAGGPDTINLALGCTYTLTTTNNTTDGPNGLPFIISVIIINGNSATIRRDPSFACPDVLNPQFRIFHVASGGDLTLNDVTVSNGCAGTDIFGGGIYNIGTLSISGSTISGNTANQRGGGIFSLGTLNISDSTLSGNATDYGGGGIGRDDGTLNINNSTLSHNIATYGGGIYNNAGTVTAVISNTLIYSNTAQTDGGGILNKVKLNIGNSTLSGNTAKAFYAGGGGGIYNAGSATLDISNSTISDNTAAWFGGGIHNIGTANVKNSILANNTAFLGNDCWEIITSEDYNLIKDIRYCTINGTTTHNITGTVPSLGPLQDNGGPTWTHALLPGSPAIDHIPYTTNGCGTTCTTDQRGVSRPQPPPPEGACDIGAYEYKPPLETPTSTSTPTPTDTPTATPTSTPTATPTSTPTPTATPTTTPTPTPTPTFTVDVACDVPELISAINTANGSGGATIMNLASGCTYTLDTVNNTTDGPNGLPSITSQITIHGNGATIQRSSTNQFRIFHVASGADLTLTDITISNGNAGGYYGGGILNSGGTVGISNSTLSGNTASYGGGILNGGTLDIGNSTFSGNTATSSGGGIYNGGPLTINNSTLTSNTATSGGGVDNPAGTAGIKNTIVADNPGGNCSGTINNNGYNIDSGTSCGWGSASGSMSSTDPMLDSLADNGGPTWTHALLLGSPAIDHVPNATNGCGITYTTDQRGYARPYPTDGSCDIGAFEYDSTSCVLFGDLDNDGDVDVKDVMLVAGCWRCRSEDTCYDESYDLDKDGDIDVVDIMLVSAHWGDTC